MSKSTTLDSALLNVLDEHGYSQYAEVIGSVWERRFEHDEEEGIIIMTVQPADHTRTNYRFTPIGDCAQVIAALKGTAKQYGGKRQ